MFGVYAPGRAVAHMNYLGLYALQHRGQESAGIAVSDGGNVLESPWFWIPVGATVVAAVVVVAVVATSGGDSTVTVGVFE